MPSKSDLELCRKAIRVYLETKHIFSGGKLDKEILEEINEVAQNDAIVLASDTSGTGLRLSAPLAEGNNGRLQFNTDPATGEKYFWTWSSGEKKEKTIWQNYLAKAFKKNSLVFRTNTA